MSKRIWHRRKRLSRSIHKRSLFVELLESRQLMAAVRALPGFLTNRLTANDDSSVGPVSLGFTGPINYFGTSSSTAFVNNNGNLTFDSALSTYTPFSLSNTNRKILAPFFADVQTFGNNVVRYGTDTVDGRRAFGVEWPGVGYYSSESKRNFFELVIIERFDTGAGNFDVEFNYDQINWETGNASGGSNGLGGSSARVGFASGTNGPFREFVGSAINGAFLDSNTTTGLIHNRYRSSQNGRYVLTVRGGAVVDPDLQVEAVQVTNLPAISGGAIDVQWRVKNTGNDPTPNGWSDRVRIVNRTTGAVIANQLVAYDPLAVGNGAISPGTSRTRSARFTLPDGQPGVGTFDITVTTDALQQIFEANPTNTSEANNSGTGSFTSTLAPYPNLDARIQGVPAGIDALQQFVVNFDVRNSGNGPTSGSWKDRLYLSTTSTVNSSSVLLAEVTSLSQLAVGASYRHSLNVTAPQVAEGNYFVVAVSNADSAIFEMDRANNVIASPLSIFRPDLRPRIEVLAGSEPIANVAGSLDFGSSALNQPVTKIVTIRNLGPTELTLGTVVATNNSGFSIVSQPDARVSANGQTSFQIRFDSAVQGNRVATISIPNNDPTKNPAFTFQVTAFTYDRVDLVVTDIQVDATTTVGSAVDLSWQVTNQGTGEYRGTFSDRIWVSTDNQIGNDRFLGDFSFTGTLLPGQAVTRTQRIVLPSDLVGNQYFVVKTDANSQVLETNDNNNTAIDDRALSIQAADLQVYDVQVARVIQTGTQTQVNWKVRNSGNAATLTGATWSDRVYLSSDTTLDAGDLQLATVLNPQALAVNESYTSSASATIPYGTYGVRYMIIKSDATTQVVELDESNNVTVSSSTNISWQPPDLRVTNVISQFFAFAGAPTRITWDVRNVGLTAMLASEANWYDRVWLSTDRNLDNSDRAIGEFLHTGLLQPGEGYSQSLDITLPVASALPAGEYYVIVETDSRREVKEGPFEANNVTAETSTTQVVHTPPPDLVVDSIVAPPTTLFAGQTLNVGFRVKNAGAGDTEPRNTQWSDRVYLSTDGLLDANDRLISTLSRNGGLAATGTYDVASGVVIPSDVAGVFRLIVVANAFAQVFGDNLSNNASATSSTITIQRPPADLDVTVVNSVQNVVVNSPLTVNYAVKNVGPQATTVSSWRDRVYLSIDTTLDVNDTLLGEVTHSGSLDAGAEYQGSVTQNVSQTGSFYLIVETDSADAVFEIYPANNVQASARTVNVVPTPANLTTSRVRIPATARSGYEIPVDYRVTNTGPNATLGSNWLDRIYISADNVLGANDTLLRTIAHSGALQASPDFYDVATRVVIPENLTGAYFIIVKTDDTDAIFEVNNDDNVASTAVTVVSQPADLIVDSITAAATAESSSSLRVDWTVKNQGTGDTLVSSWRERIYLSSDNAFNPTTDQQLSEFVYTNVNGLVVGPLGASGTVSRSELVTLPNVTGQHYLFVVVDATDLVFEPLREDNNVSVARPVTINKRDVDLRVTSVTAPTTAVEGVPFNVSWTVRNVGTASTLATHWYDDVYLSTDNQLSANDLRLGTLRRSNGLGAGGEYSVTSTFGIPLGVVQGNTAPFYVLVKTDGGDTEQVVETIEDNNATAASNQTVVAKGSVPLLPNLQVPAVQAPTTGQVGQPITVSWTVENSGPGAIANGDWIDAVYLSLDRVLDRQAGSNRDTYLGFRQQTRSLANGARYSDSATFTLPAGLSGDYYVLVATDSGSVIAEGPTNELDNVGSSVSAITVEPKPPADLVVGTITIPANGLSGQTATISYTVTNAGENPAVGSWYDSLYISADEVWDVNDPLFDRVLRSGDLQPNSSYSQSVTAPLPGLIPGDYRVIVRSDIRNQIAESNEDNNIRGTLNAMTMDVQALTLGVPTTSSISQGQSVYYKVAVPAGETLVVEFDAAISSGVSELHVSRGVLPSRTKADFSSVEDLIVDRRLVIESTLEQTYYILAYGNQLSQSTSFSMFARIVQFEVFDTNFGLGGDVGNRTIAVNGTKFDNSITAALTRNDIAVATSSKQLLEGSTRAYFTFDLRNVPLGKYDVVFAIEGASPIKIRDSFEVVAGARGHLIYRTNGAELAVRRPQVSYDLIVVNDGLTDVILPLLRLTSDNAEFQLSREIQGAQLSSLDFLPIAKNGERSILRPGEKIVIPFSAIANTLGSTTFRVRDLPDTNALDLTEVRETIYSQLGGSEADDLSKKWTEISEKVGSSVRSLRQSMLSYQPFGDGANPSIISVSDYFQSLITSEFHSVYTGLVPGGPGLPPSGSQGGRTERSAPTPSKPLGYEINFNPINFFGRVDRNRAIDPTKPTVFFIHGYTDQGGNSANNFELPVWIRENIFALRLGAGFVDGEVANIIVVDWSDGAGADSFAINPANYLRAKQNSEVLGESIAAYMKAFGISPEYTTLIGHSLGGQAAGDTGEAAQSLFQGRQIQTIIALDEAGPLFENEVNNRRLDASDAVQVTSLKSSRILGNDVHTGDGSIYFNACFDQAGHVDHYKHGFPYITFIQDHYFGREAILPIVLAGGFVTDLPTGRLLYFSDLLTFAGASTWITNPGLECEGGGVLDPDLGDPGTDDWEWLLRIVQSLDPNDIVGPVGFGPEHWVAATQPLDYMIRFENDPVFATAPAQQIRITQTLDSDLDVRTFRLGDFGMGDIFIDVPDNRSFYSTRLDLRTTKGIYVDVFAGINVTTGEVFWNFTAVDPVTGDLPEDPLKGLLPPNINPPEGDGYVRYTVRAKSNVVTGTRIDAKARIIFDINEPIDTPPIFNTLDAVAPTSQVNPLNPEFVSYEGRFPVSWSGSDDVGGSALRSFDIYVSIDDGLFQPWLTDVNYTTALYDGPVGSTYAFYSVAKDNAGLSEQVPATVDTSIRVVAPLAIAVEVDRVAIPFATGTINFGSPVVSTAPLGKVLTVRNTGTQPLVLGIASLTPNSGFSFVSNMADGLTVQPGQTTSFEVRLDTAQVGVKSATLQFATNVPGKAPFRLLLSGEVRPTPALALVLESSAIVENGAFIIGSISRNTPSDRALTVNLVSSDVTQGTVPATVTIPIGASSVTFRFRPTNDTVADGTQFVTISASATGLTSSTAVARVDDDEVPILSLSFATRRLHESDLITPVTVTRNTPTSNPLTVTLTSSDPGQATVPATVTIPVGETTATFNVTALQDGLLDGDHVVEVTASVPSFDTATGSLTIVDDDVPTLKLVPADNTISENGVPLTVTVSRNTALVEALVVNLSSSESGAVTLPRSVTIAAGSASTTFVIESVNDIFAFGNKSITLTASADGFVVGTTQISVVDDDRPTLSIDLADLTIPERGGVTTGTVTRNTAVTSDLVVNLASSNTNAATTTGTVTIPAGSSRATFTVTAINDELSDGNEVVAITPNANGFLSDKVEVTVVEDDIQAIVVALAVSTIRENAGSVIGTVSRNTATTSPLVIRLSSTDTTAATVPATVTIPVGALSASFSANIVNDNRYRGDVSVQIVATVLGFADSSFVLNVLEDDPLRPWHNSRNAVDVNADGSVSPIDALLVINFLNAGRRGVLPDPKPGELAPPPYVDVSDDGSLSPIDALLVINHLNRRVSGEGEEDVRNGIDAATFGDFSWVDGLATDIRKQKRR